MEKTTIRKITGYISESEGKITINDIGGGGASNLNQSQFNAYKEAQLILNPLNGQDWEKAKSVLEKAGFNVYFS